MHNMYNEQRKLQYIKEKTDITILAKNGWYIFEKTEPRETKYGRDLCEWTSEEILDFYRYYNTPSFQALVMVHNFLDGYTNWCLINGLIGDNQNHFREIKTDALTKCVNTNALDEKIFSREELLEEIRQFPNYQDQFVFLGLFEGIPMKGDCLRKVKLSDLNGYELTLADGTTRTISKQLRHVMEEADKETEYITMGTKQRVIECNDEPTIIKTLNRKTVQRNSTLLIGTRIRKCVKFLGYEEGITMRNIQDSGRIDFMRRFAREHNVNIYETIFNASYRETHEKIYGKIQNLKVFWDLYEKYLID